MLQCPSVPAVKAQTLACIDLEVSLEEMGTHPDLSTLITMAVDTGKKPVCNTNSSDICLQDIVDAQTDIGWKRLQFGFVAAAWRNTQ